MGPAGMRERGLRVGGESTIDCLQERENATVFPDWNRYVHCPIIMSTFLFTIEDISSIGVMWGLSNIEYEKDAF